MNTFLKRIDSLKEKISTNSGAILFYVFLLVGTVALAHIAKADTTCNSDPGDYFATGNTGCTYPYPCYCFVNGKSYDY